MPHLAPAGTPVTLADIALGASAMPRISHATLSDGLRRISGLANAWPVSSGRAAMVLILRAMRATARATGRDEVLIPAYTCYSVPAAIELAGLKPRLCDVDPQTLALDPADLESRDLSRTLAVISANLYGLPNALPALEDACRRAGVYLLDDGAQALGARVGARAVGAFGDAGLYSFDKGKIISTMQGGAIVCRDGELASALAKEIAALPPSAFAETAGNFVKLVAYSVFLRPALYGLFRKLPFAPLGRTPYETDYPIARLSGFQTGVAARLLARVDDFNAARRSQAEALTIALRDHAALELPLPVTGALPAYARFPVRVRDAARRAPLIAALDAAGIGATASYPLALCDVPQVMARLPAGDRDCPGAREVAATLVTLPTHAYCPPDHAARVLAVVERCLS
jgi:perosamine synthetase